MSQESSKMFIQIIFFVYFDESEVSKFHFYHKRDRQVVRLSFFLQNKKIN